MYYLLKASGLKHKSSNSSFDRLFPNQDQHCGKEIGNLIALPLQKSCVEKGNSCFIDIDTLTPHKDQLLFLRSIEKVSVKQLDETIITPTSSWRFNTLPGLVII